MASVTSSFSPATQIHRRVEFNRTRTSSTSNFIVASSRVSPCSVVAKNLRGAQIKKRFVVKAVEAETLVKEEAEVNYDSNQPGSVSPSDVLTMLFQAEGTMKESAIPTVTKALEEVEGVNDLKVQLLEGIASVELSIKTTIQATGVASGLVEVIQGSGFKLQTLNLSFLDEVETAD